ncbi:MAG: DUF2330 domain-containing protein [bacterium]
MMNHQARCPAFILIVFIIITLLALPKTSPADGMYFKQTLVPDAAELSKLIHSPDQKAVIIWDPETKMERMIISTTAKSEDLANLCWLVPIKSSVAPTVKECNFGIFTDVAKEFAPKILVSYYSIYGYGGYFSAQEIPGVIEIDFEEIDVYDIHILHVTDADSLVQWLEDHDFFVPDGAEDVFNEYAGEGCYFVANRIDLVNKHADLINALETYVPDLLADLLEGEATIDQVIEQIKQKIVADAQASVAYDTSVAVYFLSGTEYNQLGYGVDASLVNSVREKIASKFSGLKETLNDLRSGVATPLLFEFSPSLERPVYPLLLTSLVPEDIHIEVYVIAPYRVFDLNGILTHDPPLTESDYAELYMQSQREYDSFLPPVSYYNYYIPKYEMEEDYKVFLNLTHALRDKITEHYDIPLPQGDLWGTRMVYKGKAEDLISDAQFGDILRNRMVNLFEMGSLYAQIFEPYTYVFTADYTDSGIESHVNGETFQCNSIQDLMLNPDNFLLVQDPNDPNDPVVRYWTGLGADPNLFGQNDPNMAALFERDSFSVDLSLPIFADPNLRLNGSMAKHIINQGPLEWKITFNPYIPPNSSIQPFQMGPLDTDPYDGVPTYLPAYYRAIEAARTFYRPNYPPEFVFMLEGALWNANIKKWPNIAALDFTAHYFEDLHLTIEVSNGVHTDVRTFPMSVVNYPVENYSPVLQLDMQGHISPGSENLIFYVGERGEYMINFIDPDCFIFSQAYNVNGQTPASSHVPSNTPGKTPRKDMSYLGWHMNWSPTPDQYGPWPPWPPPWWPDPVQYSGLISLVLIDEGVYNVIITCSDNKGGTAFAEVTAECIDRHPKSAYHETQISPAYYLVPSSTGGLLGPPVTSHDPFGYSYQYRLNSLNTMNPSPVPFSHSGFSNTHDFTLLWGEMGAAYGIGTFPDLMPWWAY